MKEENRGIKGVIRGGNQVNRAHLLKAFELLANSSISKQQEA